ncbi:hypothetical protein [Siphonobacter sp. SORGH_AS_0500]|uniref:hypothetical protein n=1 Tax=Siphonobacter sp. SORGH_AS_0500 TaxID=1864824 RepID=UPI00285B57FA|nr:hypothetical protein [Siphonobacter sp. SORGH_AS_0500]MDR6196180.1 hypothetical protein [Siphonobacter sp. SORGH_AS_0500]
MKISELSRLFSSIRHEFRSTQRPSVAMEEYQSSNVVLLTYQDLLLMSAAEALTSEDPDIKELQPVILNAFKRIESQMECIVRDGKQFSGEKFLLVLSKNQADALRAVLLSFQSWCGDTVACMKATNRIKNMTDNAEQARQISQTIHTAFSK